MEHGLLKTYRRGCRCEACKGANAKSQRDYQQKKKGERRDPYPINGDNQ